MKEFTSDGEQFQKIVDIMETAKNAHRDAFVQKLADFFAKKISRLKRIPSPRAL